MHLVSPPPDTIDAPHPIRSPWGRRLADRFHGVLGRVTDLSAPDIAAGPALQAAPSLPWRESNPQPVHRYVQFILVVESDPALCQAIAQCLEARGYLVLSAASVREASARFIVQPALLIVAAHLPDGSGWDLLDWLAHCGRELPAVVIGARESGPQRAARTCPIMVVPQPIALDTLVAIAQEHIPAPLTAYGA